MNPLDTFSQAREELVFYIVEQLKTIPDKVGNSALTKALSMVGGNDTVITTNYDQVAEKILSNTRQSKLLWNEWLLNSPPWQSPSQLVYQEYAVKGS
ncbi:MAG: hypothetical protein QF662_06050, partial [Phycisphaerae bacterium]|nr:hypothetical protein [Phycisphaerae bacterium]